MMQYGWLDVSRRRGRRRRRETIYGVVAVRYDAMVDGWVVMELVELLYGGIMGGIVGESWHRHFGSPDSVVGALGFGPAYI